MSQYLLDTVRPDSLSPSTKSSKRCSAGCSSSGPSLGKHCRMISRVLNSSSMPRSFTLPAQNQFRALHFLIQCPGDLPRPNRQLPALAKMISICDDQNLIRVGCDTGWWLTDLLLPSFIIAAKPALPSHKFSYLLGVGFPKQYPDCHNLGCAAYAYSPGQASLDCLR